MVKRGMDLDALSRENSDYHFSTYSLSACLLFTLYVREKLISLVLVW